VSELISRPDRASQEQRSSSIFPINTKLFV